MVRTNIDDPPRKRVRGMTINEGGSNTPSRGRQESPPCDNAKGNRPMSNRVAASHNGNLFERDDDQMITTPNF